CGRLSQFFAVLRRRNRPDCRKKSFTLPRSPRLTSPIDLSFGASGANWPRLAGLGTGMRTGVRRRLTAIIALVLAGSMVLPSMAQQRFEQGWRFAPPPGVTVSDQKPRHALMLQGNA